MNRLRRAAPASPLDARIDRIRAVWAILPDESRETYLAKLDEIGQAWTGYCRLPEYTPAASATRDATPRRVPA